jgi:hypothetical protein
MLWLLAVLAPAFAQDDDDDLGDDIDIPTAPAPAPKPKPGTPPAPAPAPDPDPVTPDDEDDGLDSFKDAADDEDLLGDEAPGPTSGDSEQVYRAAMARLGKLEPDEELAGWEAYLAQYPSSVFKPRIEARMDQLSDEMYEGIKAPPTDTGDANKQELNFAEGLQIENIDPRSRLQVGFEMGLPSYVNLQADYERQLARSFSFHGGVLRRYTGYSVEAGVHWALVKSLRTNMLVTLIGDLRFNTLPAFPALRPQLAIGKRFGRLDAQLQAGSDLTYRTWTSPTGDAVNAFQPAVVGGLSLFYNATDKVGVFLETQTYMKEVAADGAFDGGLFRFNVMTFGMRFFPAKTRDSQVNLGATLPYMQQWWQFHYGSIMGTFNYYQQD